MCDYTKVEYQCGHCVRASQVFPSHSILQIEQPDLYEESMPSQHFLQLEFHTGQETLTLKCLLEVRGQGLVQSVSGAVREPLVLELGIID